jgi:hypothetical protein
MALACGTASWAQDGEGGAAKQLPTIAIPFPPLPANAARPSTDPRDLEGFYVNLERPERVILDETGVPPPYRPATYQLLQRRVAAADAGHPAASHMSFCRPPGFFVNFGLNFPMRLIQKPDETLFVFEEFHALWRIRMGEAAPLPAPPRYEGYSWGHWEGDTLVVTTKGVRADTWLDIAGTGHSDKAVFTHRIRKIEGGSKLEILTRIDDPEAFKAPWTHRSVLTWRPDQTDFAEFNCEESTGTAAEAERYGTDTGDYGGR